MCDEGGVIVSGKMETAETFLGGRKHGRGRHCDPFAFTGMAFLTEVKRGYIHGCVYQGFPYIAAVYCFLHYIWRERFTRIVNCFYAVFLAGCSFNLPASHGTCNY